MKGKTGQNMHCMQRQTHSLPHVCACEQEQEHEQELKQDEEHELGKEQKQEHKQEHNRRGSKKGVEANVGEQLHFIILNPVFCFHFSQQSPM